MSEESHWAYSAPSPTPAEKQASMYSSSSSAGITAAFHAFPSPRWALLEDMRDYSLITGLSLLRTVLANNL